MFKKKRTIEGSPYDCSKGGAVLIKEHEKQERERIYKILGRKRKSN